MTAALGAFVPLEVDLDRAGFVHRAALSPTIHIEEIRIPAGQLIQGHGNPKVTVHQKDAGPQRFVHRSLHLCPQVSVAMPYHVIRPDLPARQETSVALQDQQRDWDFLARHRDLVFDNKRIQMADSVWDKVHALAEDIWMFRREIQKPGGNDFSKSTPWSHPVDCLIYGSWCLGGAYALMGLCATMGIPARELSIFGHSIAEVWIDGRWCFVDSIGRFPKEGGTNMLRESFGQVRLDPFNPAYPFCPEQRETYWETDILSTMYPDNGLWLQQCRRTYFVPQTALAFYPGWTDPRFKSHHPDRLDLVWGRKGFTDNVILKKGEALARRFWLGSLAETRGLLATFHGSCPAGRVRVPEGGGDWFIAVNERIYPLRDLGGWQFHQPGRADAPTWTHEFSIPLKDLREHGWNTLAIGAAGSGHEFLTFGATAMAELPVEACWCPEIGQR